MDTTASIDTIVLIYAALMALAVLIYALLDGYDLGVGILLPMRGEIHHEEQRDQMIASIGPFWDANETWLVLAIGLLLIAFPSAYNAVLYELYIPATIMLVGLILRGVAFDFRAKVALDHKQAWDWSFKLGSSITAITQGYMLGRYVLGFQDGVAAQLFALLSGIGVMAAYAYIGACWLVMKGSGDLQRQAARKARLAGRLTLLGVASVSLINPWLNATVYENWFSLPGSLVWFHIPLISLLLFIVNDRLLKRIPLHNDHGCWIPFSCTAGIFFLSFQGLLHSFYPYVIPNRMTLSEAASYSGSLEFLLVGVMIVLPVIIGYTVYSYRVFWGKSTALKYY